ncbi:MULTISPECIES: LPS export ABC transporter periplasmic protein LptC [unclassified Algibacter]|uniref:LPS export ABC transporter periplasmic protein LptC n=1 Tax=unclassified Algibacter TaxID=2615009 RepID=UPI0018EEE270|nr:MULTISPECIES: LPS export ABC transporter periplasmic protein LptC [unclassified Algibacter]MCL5130182.1 LPS export ABC transporter periplasmic protein LptC [Algibacter sp. L4_22]
MIRKKTYHILNIVMLSCMAMFFSCNNSLKEVQKIGVSENEPIGVAENINLKHTDSGRVTTNLISTKMLDYSNRDFPYYEFVDDFTLYIYGDDDTKSTVVADYAIIYTDTDLIDLQGHVVITMHDGSSLKSDQLFYDQRKEWLFTNNPVTYKTKTDEIHGNGFDSDTKFKKAEVLEVTGIITMED